MPDPGIKDYTMYVNQVKLKQNSSHCSIGVRKLLLKLIRFLAMPGVYNIVTRPHFV